MKNPQLLMVLLLVSSLMPLSAMAIQKARVLCED